MSETRDDGGPAYPIYTPDMPVEGGPGMSMRDWFAAQALPQAVMDYDRKDRGKPVTPYAVQGIGTRCEIIANQAYRYADAMLKERQS